MRSPRFLLRGFVDFVTDQFRSTRGAMSTLPARFVCDRGAGTLSALGVQANEGARQTPDPCGVFLLPAIAGIDYLVGRKRDDRTK
jgi:hypothetical protein